jgi:hypothetical protein
METNINNLVAEFETSNTPNHRNFEAKASMFTKFDLKDIVDQIIDPGFTKLLEDVNEAIISYWVKKFSRPKISAPTFTETTLDATGNRAVVSFNSAIEGEASAIVETVAAKALEGTNYQMRKSHTQGSNKGRAEDSLWISRKLTDTEEQKIQDQNPPRDNNWFEMHRVAKDLELTGRVKVLRDNDELILLVHEPIDKSSQTINIEALQERIREIYFLEEAMSPVKDMTEEIRAYHNLDPDDNRDTTDYNDILGFTIDFQDLLPLCHEWEVVLSIGENRTVYAPKIHVANLEPQDRPVSAKTGKALEENHIASGIWFGYQAKCDLGRARAILDKGLYGREEPGMADDNPNEYKESIQDLLAAMDS